MKCKRVEARVSIKDYQTLAKKCNDLNINKSEYFRRAIRGFIPDYKLRSDINKILYELRKIGVNINQVAKHTNQTSEVNELLLKEYLKKLDSVISAIRINLTNNNYGCNKVMEDKY